MLRTLLLTLLLITGCSSPTGDVAASFSEHSSLDDLRGRPSVILFGSTSCPHCQQALPTVVERVYEPYKERVNLWVQVTDRGRFEADSIPQGFNTAIDFVSLTGAQCAYVPSWVVLDAQLQPIIASCGNERSMQEMIAAIERVI